MMLNLLFLNFILILAAFAAEKDLSPTEKFVSIIRVRQDSYEKLSNKIFKEEVCPGDQFGCVVTELRKAGLESSADLDNGTSLLAYIAQKKFQKGECKEICRMNLYAEYSAALLDFLSGFDRNKIIVNLFPKDHAETKFLLINEELRLFKGLAKISEKLHQIRKKIDHTKVFRPELARRMEKVNDEILKVRPSILLKGSYLSTLSADDEMLEMIVEDGMKNEKERTEKRDLISLFREEVR